MPTRATVLATSAQTTDAGSYRTNCRRDKCEDEYCHLLNVA